MSETILAAGTRAPAFTLPGDSGTTRALADFAGKKLVLYFYPKDDTSGCTKEAMEFNALRAEFAAAGAEILGGLAGQGAGGLGGDLILFVHAQAKGAVGGEAGVHGGAAGDRR